MKDMLSKRLVWLFLASVLILTLTSAASAQPGEFVKGVLQPLADGFPKRAINIIAVDDPGSRDDLYAKSLQAALKGISPVPITVSDEPSAIGGNWYTLKNVLTREGGSDGYYPIVWSSWGMITDLHGDPTTREVGAKLEDLNMVLSTDVMPYIMVQRKNTPWGPTYAGLIKYGKENPGKLKYISFEVGTGMDIACEYILYTNGVKVQKIPQGALQEVASAVGAGAGDFSVIDLPTAVTNSQAGRVDPTLVVGSEEVPEIWRNNPNVVSAKQAGLSTDIGGIVTGLGVPSKVPQAHVDWLYKLFKAAATSDVHQKRIKTIPGLSIKIVDGATVNASHKKIFEMSDPILHAIGMHIDDKK